MDVSGDEHLPDGREHSVGATHHGSGPLNANLGSGTLNNIVQRGTGNVLVHCDYHSHPPPRSETPPQPTHTLPFVRDRGFVERAELGDVVKNLSVPGARVALWGLGGVGKSQLAIEHCYRLRDKSPQTWVLWIHARSAARFDQDIQTLAADLKIQGWDKKDASGLQLVRGWLLDSSRKWLIVIDNADDVGFLFEAPKSDGTSDARTRIEYLPACSHGSILITTRWQETARRLVDSQDIITLQPDKDHAIELLTTKLGRQKHDATTERLAAALEYMPLAITQAAAYIRKAAPRCTIEDYLLKLEKSDRSKATLLSNSSKELRRDMQAKDSILTTWQISFEHILNTRRSAADLLSLMSFFDNQGISDFLVKFSHRKQEAEQDTDNDHDDESSSENDSEAAFEDDIDTLRDYSFVSADKSILQMHRLVQLAAQIWLKERQQHTKWEVQSLQRLDEVYPNAEYEQWQRCRSLYPHAALALKSKVKDKDGLVALGSLLNKASWFARTQGTYAEAEMMAKRSWSIATSLYGEHYHSTLTSMASLASTYGNQGRWKKAEELEVKVMETLRTVLGVEHPDTLTSMANLASTFWNQGRWKEAEELEVKVMETRRTVLGVEHPDTLTSMNNLAFTYRDTGRAQEAEQLMAACVEGRKRALGVGHPFTEASCSALESMRSQLDGLTVE